MEEFGLRSRDPSAQIMPTLGPTVCRYCLHWAVWISSVGSRRGRNSGSGFKIPGPSLHPLNGGI